MHCGPRAFRMLLGLGTGELSVRASLTIRAPCKKVVAIYRDIASWPRIFPTIRATRILREDRTTQVIEVDHYLAGRVINRLRKTTPTEIELEEIKPKYTGRFVNRFEATPEGTRYTVTAEIRPNGFWYLVSGPWLNRCVRRQIVRLVLEPVRRAAEGQSS
jgi:Polyketide cyclase / dehydrase and lipid transport